MKVRTSSGHHGPRQLIGGSTNGACDLSCGMVLPLKDGPTKLPGTRPSIAECLQIELHFETLRTLPKFPTQNGHIQDENLSRF